jgi:1-acyl-sn-glycerol-3-phosphate acyltransferase
MLYRILKWLVGLGIRMYYKEVRIHGSDRIPSEGPVILIANHPNTLMDAWMVGYASKRKVHFLAKAMFFNSPFKKKVLSALGMIPINRKSDGATSGVSNKDSFEACYKLLEQGEVLVVFPEGTSYLERRLRELKTGTARIALEVEKRNGGKLDVNIVPVGLNYIDADTFRGKVMVHIGKPISMSEELVEAYVKTPGKAAQQLTEQFRIALTRVFVTMDDAIKETISDKLRWIFDTRYTNRGAQVETSIQLLRTIQAKMDSFALTTPWKVEAISKQVEELEQDLVKAGIRPDFLDRPYRATLYSRQFVQTTIFLAACFPLFLFGWLHNIATYKFIGFVVPKMSKDVEYHAPLVVLLGLVLYPITYVIFWLSADAFFELWWWQELIYLGVMPLSGIFAHYYVRSYHHLRSKRKFSRFARKRREFFEEVKSKREKLKDLIFSE